MGLHAGIQSVTKKGGEIHASVFQFGAIIRDSVRCGCCSVRVLFVAVRCGAVRCGAVRCGAVRCGLQNLAHSLCCDLLLLLCMPFINDFEQARVVGRLSSVSRKQ